MRYRRILQKPPIIHPPLDRLGYFAPFNVVFLRPGFVFWPPYPPYIIHACLVVRLLCSQPSLRLKSFIVLCCMYVSASRLRILPRHFHAQIQTTNRKDGNNNGFKGNDNQRST